MMCDKPWCKAGPNSGQIKNQIGKHNRSGITPLPCGQCLHCRINQRRIWTARLLMEGVAAPVSAFFTLTYRKEFRPDGDNLDKKELQKTLKKINRIKKFRYFAVGEYGGPPKPIQGGKKLSDGFMPHYHFMAFGLSNKDIRLVEHCWQKDGYLKGKVDVGDLNRHSAQYITGYNTAKLSKHEIFMHGALKGRKKEFQIMSRKPAIGNDAIVQMAKNIKRDKILTGKVVDSIQIGKKIYPIGRTLRTKLATMIGCTDDITQLYTDNYQNRNFIEYTGDNGFSIEEINRKTLRKRERSKRLHRMYRKRSKI